MPKKDIVCLAQQDLHSSDHLPDIAQLLSQAAKYATANLPYRGWLDAKFVGYHRARYLVDDGPRGGVPSSRHEYFLNTVRGRKGNETASITAMRDQGAVQFDQFAPGVWLVIPPPDHLAAHVAEQLSPFTSGSDLSQLVASA